MEFEWDPNKAAANLRRHGVSFTEAATVFDDPLSATVLDPDHSTEEDRLIIFGQSYRRRLLIVSFSERGERFRIISARELTRAESETYEEKSHE
jgi:uncharacterized DUF497 family protein